MNYVGKGNDGYLLNRVQTTQDHYAYLKIADGCYNHCTYCLIPKIRGKYRSYPMEKLIVEAKELGDIAELIIVAQDSTRYGEDLYGENRFALLKSAREFGFEKLTICENFEFAVRIAALRAKAGQTVLLSPASASFDEFASYEERGDKFVEIIQSFARENVVDEYENTQSDTVDEEEIAQEIITKNASNPSANFAQEQSSTPIAPITAIEDFKLDRAERFIDEDAE